MNQSIDKARSTDYDEVRVGLTDRQLRVARMKGSNTYDEIGDQLGISDRTAEKHYQNAKDTVGKYPDYVRAMLDDIAVLRSEVEFLEIAREIENASGDFSSVDVDVTVE